MYTFIGYFGKTFIDEVPMEQGYDLCPHRGTILGRTLSLVFIPI